MHILSLVTDNNPEWVVVSYKRKYVHELLVNRLFKPAQEKVWLGELTLEIAKWTKRRVDERHKTIAILISQVMINSAQVS